MSGMTGRDAAMQVLRSGDVPDVHIEQTQGNLTDHYDPRKKVIRLSQSVYASTSVAALGVAAHEAGHAIQHHTGYGPLKLRNAIIPITNIGSNLAMPLILLGLIFSLQILVELGIIFFGLVTVFQLVTLPVEFNASARALRCLESYALSPDELAGARRVLRAAAMTYVAALAVSLANLLRLFLLFGRRNDR